MSVLLLLFVFTLICVAKIIKVRSKEGGVVNFLQYYMVFHTLLKWVQRASSETLRLRSDCEPIVPHYMRQKVIKESKDNTNPDSTPVSSCKNSASKLCLRKVPGGQGAQVFVGTSILFALAAAPVFLKSEKKGHDYFSQSKPAEIEAAEEARSKAVERLNKA